MVGCTQLPSPRSTELRRPDAVIPFQLRGGHVIVTTRLAGSPTTLRLALDTGALGGLWLIEAGDFRTTRGVLVLGDARPELTVSTLPASDPGVRRIRAYAGIDGLLGEELFNRYVVTIDYDREVLELRSVHQANARATPVHIEFQRGIPRVPIDIQRNGERQTVLAFVDTGIAFDLMAIGPEDCGSSGFPTRFSISDRVYEGRVQRFKRIRLAAFQINQPLANCATGSNHYAIGNGLLRRFGVTLDYRHRLLWLEPRRLDSLTEYDMAGLRYRVTPNGQKYVAEVIPGSAAAQSGVQIGDILVSVDGHDAALLSVGELLDLQSGPPGERRRFLLKRADDEIVVILVLRRSI
jgi:hypothetical protein